MFLLCTNLNNIFTKTYNETGSRCSNGTPGSRCSSGTPETTSTSATVSSLTGREIMISRSTMNWKDFLLEKIINLFRKTFLEVRLPNSLLKTCHYFIANKLCSTLPTY